MKTIVSILLIIFGINPSLQAKVPAHDLWNELLKKNVSMYGKVNYKAFKKDVDKLDKYLALLSENKPDEKTWSANEQKAFWINAYNAFTVKLIVDNYPVKSINDVVTKMKITSKTSPWDIKFIKIGNENYSLNNIEHEKLRKIFEDARFHFVLVCAAKSCPILLNEACLADRLEMQLEKQTKLFLNDKVKNKISANHLQLSKLFEWYASDFKTEKSTLVDFINKYATVKISPKASISYLEYSWELNE
jgi:hypothetical protein